MNPVVIISQAVATGGLAGARPVLTLFLMQLYAGGVASTQLPEGLAWILNPYVIGVLGALAVVEHFIRTDPDFEQMMKVPNNVISTGVALMTSFLLVHMGIETGGLETLEPASETAAFWTQSMFTAGADGSTMTVSMIVAVVASLGLAWLRGQAMDLFDTLAVPSKWWRWIEAGGVAGLLTIVVLLPFMALAMAILMVLASGIAAFFIWSYQRRAESKRRTPCPSCNHPVRHEASVCPECGAELTPTTILTEATAT